MAQMKVMFLYVS